MPPFADAFDRLCGERSGWRILFGPLRTADSVRGHRQYRDPYFVNPRYPQDDVIERTEKKALAWEATSGRQPGGPHLLDAAQHRRTAVIGRDLNGKTVKVPEEWVMARLPQVEPEKLNCLSAEV